MGVRIEIPNGVLSVDKYHVAPRVGAWIEIYKPLDFESYPSSHPVWVCGLKEHLWRRSNLKNQVAPCVGVQIEIAEKQKKQNY